MRRFLAAAIALLGLTACSSSPGTTTPGGGSVATVVVTPGTASLAAAQTVQLTATAKDSAGNTLSDQTVTWSSTPTTVATVSSSGLVTGVSAGTATITATTGGKSGTAIITASGLAEVNAVGAAGGTVIADHGNVTLVFPAGAVTTSTPISVTPLAPLTPPPSGYAGSRYELGPTGTQFAQPVMLTIPYSPAALPAGLDPSQLFLYTLVGSTWQVSQGSYPDTVAHTVTGPITHFSQWMPCYGGCYNTSSVYLTTRGAFTVPAGQTIHIPARMFQFGAADGATATVSIEGLPAGITGTGGTFTGSGSNGSLTFSAVASTSGGVYPFLLHITAPAVGINDSLHNDLQVIGQSFTFSASPLAVPINQGGTATSALSVTRSIAFSGAIAVTAENLPPGVTASFAPASISGTSSTVTFTATSSAQLGGATVTLRGKTPNLADATIPISLFVSPSNSAGFTIAGTPPSISIAPGSAGSTGVRATRTNGFAGAISYVVTGAPTGLGATLVATPVADSMALNVTASASLAVGSYPLTITATSGTVVQTAIVAVSVAATGHLAVHLDFTSCAVAIRPIWVAYQDGSAPFVHLTGTGDTYDFTLNSPTGGYAAVSPNGSSFATVVTYGTQAELVAQAGRLTCSNVVVGKTVHATVANLSATTVLSLGTQTTFIDFPGDGTGTLTNVPVGPQDAVAFRFSSTPSLIFRRGVDVADQGSLAPFDFSSSEAVTPPSALLSGVAAQFIQVSYAEGGSTCSFTPIYFGGGYGNTFYGLPASMQHSGDIYSVVAVGANGASGAAYFHTFGPQSITIGDALLSNAVFAIQGGSYRRLGALFNLTGYAAYHLSYNPGISTINPNANSMLVNTTARYAGASNVSFSAPDLSGIDGFLTSWEPTGTLDYSLYANSPDPLTAVSSCTDGLKVQQTQITGVI